MKKDIIITFIVEFFVLLSNILVYKFAATSLGKEGFSEYAVSKRIISFIQPTLLMGIGVGLPRYIAYADASLNYKQNSKDSFAYFMGGFVILVIITIIVTSMSILYKEKAAFLLFGDLTYKYLIIPISLIIIGLTFHSLCYGYFRGKLFIYKANILQLINLCIIPLVAFMTKNTTKDILFTMGLSYVAVSFFFVFLIMKNAKWETKNIILCAKELLIYGIQRIPGDFGLTAILSLPTTFVAHVAGLEVAGYTAFSISLLSLMAGFFSPIGIVLLPKASRAIANKDVRLLKRYITIIVNITIPLVFSVTIFYEIFANKIINLYLGENFSESEIISTTRIVMIGSIAYTYFSLMRNILDAYYVRAINSKNILFSLLVFLFSSGLTIAFANKYIYILICLVISMFFLSSLTLIEIKKITSIN